jgi:mRNA interferase MazF
MDMVIQRFGVYLTRLDPTVGREMAKTRPCLVVSPDMMNRLLPMAIVAPLTTTSKEYEMRVPCRFAGKSGEIALDQIRSVDRTRILKFLGVMDMKTAMEVLRVLQEMFA